MLEGKYRFDVIFMDPPYKSGLEEDVLGALTRSSILKGDTLLIVEAALERDFAFAEALGYQIVKEKNYKTNKHIFLKKIS